jgi:hypothetical protein
MSETRNANNDNEHDHDAAEVAWKIGDRVVVHSLQKASHLNGRHGYIGGKADEATGRLPIDFDLFDPRVSRVMVKPVNLEPESSIAANEQQATPSDSADVLIDPFHKSGAENGILVEEEGRPICVIFDALRFLVGSVLHRDPEMQAGLEDVERLRSQGQAGLLKINRLMGAAWSHWTDRGSYHTPEDKSVYELLVQFFADLPAANKMDTTAMPPEFLRASESLKHLTAVRGWHVRIHGGK